MIEIILLITISIVIGILTFLIVYNNPPKHRYCPDKKPHDWSKWKKDDPPIMQYRSCNNCGYTDRTVI